MRRIRFSLALLPLLAMFSGACTDTGTNSVLSIDAKGSVLGVAFLDRNGNGVLDLPADGPFPGIAIEVLPAAGGTAIARTITTATGSFALRDLPVGDYQLRVDPSTVPDSVQIVNVDSTHLRVLAADSVPVLVTVGFPSVTVAKARTLKAGRRIFLDGVTLNAWSTFADSTLNVADSTGSIRATRVVPTGVTLGTRVRLLGTTDVQNGQPVITDVTALALGTGRVPDPVHLTTGQTAAAKNGTLDAALVQVDSVPVVGTQTNTAGDFIVSVNDGSGLLDIVLSHTSGITVTNVVPGALLTAAGVLVPSPTSAATWQLKPRVTADLRASFPTVTVAQARALPAGRVVSLQGVALNSWLSFGDSTVHVADSTGNIRSFRVAPVNLFAGDRVRFVGTVATRDGQPVLINVTPSVLGPGVLPLPTVVNTATANSADSGRLDAALVRVTSATITDTATVAGDFVLKVDDGSGVVQVVLDFNVGFALAPFVKGKVLDITGLLVTSAGGRDWRLKPRQQSDLVVVR